MSDEEYGFRWGPMVVSRLAHFQVRANQEVYVLGIRAGGSSVEVYVSRTGRSVRVFKNGRELK